MIIAREALSHTRYDKFPRWQFGRLIDSIWVSDHLRYSTGGCELWKQKTKPEVRSFHVRPASGLVAGEVEKAEPLSGLQSRPCSKHVSQFPAACAATTVDLLLEKNPKALPTPSAIAIPLYPTTSPALPLSQQPSPYYIVTPENLKRTAQAWISRIYYTFVPHRERVRAQSVP